MFKLTSVCERACMRICPCTFACLPMFTKGLANATCTERLRRARCRSRLPLPVPVET